MICSRNGAILKLGSFQLCQGGLMRLEVLQLDEQESRLSGVDQAESGWMQCLAIAAFDAAVQFGHGLQLRST